MDITINPNKLPIFDSHAHFDDTAFKEDLSAVVAEMKENGVVGVINNGVNYESSAKIVELSENYDIFYSAVGVHPEDLYNGEIFSPEKILPLLSHPKTVAIGEIGIDYHWDTHPADLQKQWFEDQLDFAKQVDLPVIVHDREAHNDTLEILKKHKPKGVLHCFSGSNEMAKEVLKLGMYIGVGGVVTFKNARKLVEVVADLPLDRLLLETDAPYLSPEPFRGKRCRSDLIYFTAQKVAEIKGISTEDVLKASMENIKTLYNKIK